MLKDNLEKDAINFLKSDLKKQNWSYNIVDDTLHFQHPKYISKIDIKDNYSINRLHKLRAHSKFIDENLDLLIENLASGEECLNSLIDPIIEVCTSKTQLNLFKMCRLYWSSPYSDYVGRRIKILIRDNSSKKKSIIGIAALGSPILNLRSRDEFIGWDLNAKKENINSCMDIYVLGAMPPYNHLLCGKLIAYMLMSNEIKTIYSNKYSTNKKREELVCLFTTSLYGKSSIYNRIKYQNNLSYIPIGFTKGQGTFHISDTSFQYMKEVLRKKKRHQSNNISKGGPNWKIRVTRDFSRIANIDADSLLTHGFKKEIYVVPLAHDYREYLNKSQSDLVYFDYSLSELIHFWKYRWLSKRKLYIENNSSLKKDILNFTPEDISIFYRIPKKAKM